MAKIRAIFAVVGTFVFVLLASSPVALADDTFDECISREYDNAAYNQLAWDGVIDDPNLHLLRDDKKIQEEKEKHPEEFERLRKHYAEGAEDQGTVEKLTGTLGRGFNNFNCAIDYIPDKAVGAISNKVSEFWEEPIGKFAKSVMEGSSETLAAVMTWWMDFGIGTEGSILSESTSEQFSMGISNIFWVVILGSMMINVAILGARLAWTRRQGLADGMEDVGMFIWNVAIYAGVVPAVIFSLMSASDVLSVAIMENFGPLDGVDFLADTQLGESDAGPIFMLLIAGISFLGSAMQILALAARLLIFPVLVGLLPLLAGLTATEWGQQALGSAKNWLIALLAYKPVAALIYVAAWWIATTPNEGGWQWSALQGLVVGIAGFSIIAVAKVLVPALASMGGGSVGAMGSGGMSALGAVGGSAVGSVASSVGRMRGGGSASAATGAGRGGGGGTPPASGASGGGGRGGGGGGGTSPSSPSPAPTGGPSSGAAPTSGAGASGAGTSTGGGGGGASRPSGGGQPSGGVSTSGRGGSQPVSPSRGSAPVRAGGANLATRVRQGAHFVGQQISQADRVSNDAVGAAGHPGQVRR